MRIKTASHAAIFGGLAMAMAHGAHADDAAPKAFSYDIASTSDAIADIGGGLKRGGRIMHNIDLTAGWDGQNGWSAFGYVLEDFNGGFSSNYAGDAQTVSNIDADPGLRLFEAWVKKSSADDKASVTFGLINLNGIFDVQDVGGVFLNSSHGIGPDYSQAGPSIFPVSALGAVGQWRLDDHFAVRAGVFDGVPGDANDDRKFVYVRLGKDEGAHVVAEGEYDFDGGAVKLGHWQGTVAQTTLDGLGVKKPQGTYGQVQFTFVKGKDDDHGLKGWVRAGQAEGQVLDLDRYTGGGVVLTGTFKGRDDDVAGLAVARAHWGAPYRALQAGPVAEETTWEASYQAAIRPGISLQPDIQYVTHPGGDYAVKNAVVVALRLKIDWLGL